MTEVEVTHDELLNRIGGTLLSVQWTERALEAALVVAFPVEQLSSQSLRADREMLEGKTLGKLANVLRQRAELRPEFEELVREFVKSRNLFAHHLVAHFDVATADGRKKAYKFCGGLGDVAQKVAEALSDAFRVRISEMFMQIAVHVEPGALPPVRTYEDVQWAVKMIEDYVHTAESIHAQRPRRRTSS